jgi:hypothetical protein
VLSGVSDKTMQICPESTFSDKFKILLREAVSYNTFSEKIFCPYPHRFYGMRLLLKIEFLHEIFVEK